MERYVIALRRECRHRAPADWAATLDDVEGLVVHPSSNPNRIQVEASPAAIAQARRRLGELCHIESIIPHSIR